MALRLPTSIPIINSNGSYVGWASAHAVWLSGVGWQPPSLRGGWLDYLNRQSFFTMPEKTRTTDIPPPITREIRPHGLSSLNRKTDLPNSHWTSTVHPYTILPLSISVHVCPCSSIPFIPSFDNTNSGNRAHFRNPSRVFFLISPRLYVVGFSLAPDVKSGDSSLYSPWKGKID